MRDAWASIRLICAISWRLHPRAAILAFAECIGRFLIALNPLMIGLLITGIASHDLPLLIIGAVGVTAAQGFSQLLMAAGVQARLEVTDLIRHDFDERLARLLGTAPTLRVHLDPDEQDAVQALRDRMGSLGMAFNSLVNIVNNLVTPVTTLAVAAGADLRLLLLVPIAVAATWSTRYPMQWEQRAEHESAHAGRLSAHLTDVTLAATPAAELRVLGARSWILDRLTAEVGAWRRPFVRSGWRTATLESLISAVYVAAAAAILAWITYDALHGRVSPGRVATGVLVVSDLRDSVESANWAMGAAARMLRAVGRYRWLFSRVDTELAEHGGTGTPPTRLRDGIRLEGVTVRYPGATRDTLSDVTLDLPAGKTVAVVGENGAGKSTLVGVLIGLYDVREGRVSVDGTDLRDLDLRAWRAQCSGAFQDHAQLELTARQAIAAGEVSVAHAENGPSRYDDRVHTALRRAAATDVLNALPAGLDTQLGAQWPGGVGLSGGQWQRLAIARGMMRHDPLLLVLDEPTSALDPATEHALFDHYAAAARAANSAGGVTILVTHRFSTVSTADLVVVLDQGRVVEQGTHRELLAANGRYAELYELQAAGYR